MGLRGGLHILAVGAAAGGSALAAGLSGIGPAGVAAAAGAGAIAAGLLARDRTSGGRRNAERQPAAAEPVRADGADLPAGLGRALLERMPVGVVLISPERRVVFINPEARNLFGRGPEIGFPVEALRTPRLLEALERALGSGEGARLDVTLSRASEAHICAHIVPLPCGLPDAASGSGGVLMVIEDQTQARRADELHRDFVANASHELKTPLAAVSGLIETLQGHARGDAEAEERFLAMMSAQTERMRRLVEDLLSLNRIEINERIRPSAPQPLMQIVRETAEPLAALAREADMEIRVIGEADEIVVPGDREELGQVFRNLIENALRYGRPSREVRLSLIGPGAARPGMVGVAVEDDGPGIQREHLPRLTERFYRVSVSRSREQGGTGLGLAIVKHILNRHRGTLEIESRPGEGSRFTVWLPVAENRGTDAPVRSEAEAS